MKPPYRADQVGSLLRPAELAEARKQWKQGALSADKLKAIEDRAIREAVAKQEAIGLRAVTDGEFRRDWWHLDFLGQLGGVTTKVGNALSQDEQWRKLELIVETAREVWGGA
jgi:5-methyltetrahydropteroyltriglutamate--homocysteine methyltransferase